MQFARLAGVGIILGSFGGPAAKPTITLADASPVVIVGSGYTAGARFFVTYRSGVTQVRRNVVASLTGRYRVVLAGVSFKRCSSLRVTAPGASLAVAQCTSLHGTVRIEPTRPVCRQGVPCAKPAAHLLLSFSRGQVHVQARTDTLGRYRVRLAPGTWTLSTGVGIRPAPIRFVVPHAASAKRDFSIDTGIR
ncbi:MAG TPA: hypothetical protein VLJ44_10830 [Gaiellaceae bacterium]|nr:hypothetical protein [Gaiellaceae bacterium]